MQHNLHLIFDKTWILFFLFISSFLITWLRESVLQMSTLKSFIKSWSIFDRSLRVIPNKKFLLIFHQCHPLILIFKISQYLMSSVLCFVLFFISGFYFTVFKVNTFIWSKLRIVHLAVIFRTETIQTRDFHIQNKKNCLLIEQEIENHSLISKFSFFCLLFFFSRFL